MKYPYIGKTALGSIVLFYSEETGRVIYHTGDIPVGRVDDDWVESEFTNITREYLDGKCVKVISLEHSKFVQKLAFNAGFKWPQSFGKVKHTGYLYYINCANINHESIEEITIPLPPKQIQTATPEEEFEVEQIMKNAGDNLVLGCEDSKCDEWPKIGDEVLICNIEPDSRVIDFNNEKVKVIAKTKGARGTVLTLSHPSQGIGAIMLVSNHVKKPKTPEGELRESLSGLILAQHRELLGCDGVATTTLMRMADDSAEIITKTHNITKKPQ